MKKYFDALIIVDFKLQDVDHHAKRPNPEASPALSQ